MAWGLGVADRCRCNRPDRLLFLETIHASLFTASRQSATEAQASGQATDNVQAIAAATGEAKASRSRTNVAGLCRNPSHPVADKRIEHLAHNGEHGFEPSSNEFCRVGGI